MPYIGAKAVQDAGVKGKGVKVAVLDSGIDYTHAAFGGSGNPADWARTTPTSSSPGRSRPRRSSVARTSSAARGPAGPVPRPRLPIPIRSMTGRAAATAPTSRTSSAARVASLRRVDLYAVKVCSSVSTSCSGIALIQGMEWTVDPNGDGNFRDRMHLINMSLGSPYGQPFDDDLSLAVENATKVGHPDRRVRGEQRRQAVRDGHSVRDGLGALGCADRGAERRPAADASAVLDRGSQRLRRRSSSRGRRR